VRSFPKPILAAATLCVLISCGRGPSAEKKPVEHPAETTGTPVEAELSTVTLTERAVQRLGIETVAVARRPVRRTRILGGELVVPPGRSVTVTAPFAGNLTAPGGGKLPEPGTLVRREQELLRLFPIGPLGNDLAQREAEALARYEMARARSSRAEQLLRDRAGSQREAEEARSDLAIAESALQAVRNQLKALGGDAAVSASEPGAWSMRSPIDGRLGGIRVAVGQTVTPSTPLFDVTAEHPLWVRVPVYVGDLASVDREQPVTVRDIGNGSNWGATAGGPSRSAVAVPSPPSADPQAATVDLFYELDNEDGAYRPGQRVAAAVALSSSDGEGDESLVVPYSAVLYDINGGTWVYENTAPGRYVRRRVELSRVHGDQAVLARGPEPETLVVTVGAAELFGTEFGVGH
jgi:multidrug efflux pump subunit AcrA (membrane-fusion protein)